MSNDIRPENEEGYLHGYCEYYFASGKLDSRGVWVNGARYGYFEDYDSNGSVVEYWTGYYLGNRKVSADNEIGYCYIWDKEEVVV